MPLDLALLAALAATAALTGLFVGTVGVGGVILVSFLALIAGLPIHNASATALATFLFTGILGTVLFLRRGSISWRMTAPVCAGAVVFAYLGARCAGGIEARALTLMVGAIIVAAGAYILRPVAERARQREGATPAEQMMLLGVGAISGFGSGLSGAGGPLFSVPLMLLLGFAPLATVGASQVLQIIAALSASAANLPAGTVDLAVAAWVTGFELAGVVLGVRIAHAASAGVLRRLAAALCIAAGALLLARGY